jgi:hypothetical protein
MKVGIVVDALAHLAKVRDATVVTASPLGPWAFRTTARAVADEYGRLGFRRRRSHEVVVPDDCLVVHPLVGGVLATGRFPAGADRVEMVEEFSSIRIPRADGDTSGANFQVLVGFELTDEQLEFNRSGMRFRVTAGQDG